MARNSRYGRNLDFSNHFDSETLFGNDDFDRDACFADDDLGPADTGHDGKKHRRAPQEDRRARRRRERLARTDPDQLCEGLSEDDGDRRAVARPRPRPVTRHRDDGQESFKCGHCKTFVGPTISGGRHRNHCPICLYSRHVDGNRPGDRASSCRSLMEPVGTFFKPKGEQAILHRCRGCGLERHNRVAADDSQVTLMRLPLVPPRVRGKEVPAAEPVGPADLLDPDAALADELDLRDEVGLEA